MTATQVPIRRGLPRVPGGEPWPPAGLVEVGVTPDFLAETGEAAAAPAAAAPPPVPPSTTALASTAAAAQPSPTPAEDLSSPLTTERRVPLRRGLPRTASGEPWPPAGSGVWTVAVDQAGDAVDPAAPAPSPTSVPILVSAPETASADRPAEAPVGTAPVGTAPVGAVPVAKGPVGEVLALQTSTVRMPLRRGLPRTPGGDPWPPAGVGVLTVAVDAPPLAPTPEIRPEPENPSVDPAPQPVAAPVAPAASVATSRPIPPVALPVTPAVQATAAPDVSRARRVTETAGVLAQLVKRFPVPAVVVGVAVVGLGLMLAGWLVSTAPVTAFIARFPGSYPLPETAEPGFPAWVRWNHFLNVFFILLIIRTGLQVRREQKPPAYWTPRSPRFGGKISLTLWMHQGLDLLWLLNGFTFITLLFVTGHWVRLVPTSWAVFPDALSAVLQYASLSWPTDSGWTNYNSLQQLAYFTVVFVAAPLAAVTGFRMSGFWPARAKRLSAAYPVELARKVHFPTMIFFVVFVIMHVIMVFATGALRNLNHMFSGTEATGWGGFWILVLALAAIALAWELVRPTVLAPVASLTGKVSQR